MSPLLPLHCFALLLQMFVPPSVDFDNPWNYLLAAKDNLMPPSLLLLSCLDGTIILRYGTSDILETIFLICKPLNTANFLFPSLHNAYSLFFCWHSLSFMSINCNNSAWIFSKNVLQLILLLHNKNSLTRRFWLQQLKKHILYLPASAVTLPKLTVMCLSLSSRFWGSDEQEEWNVLCWLWFMLLVCCGILW